MTIEDIRTALKSVIDPELGQNIVDLGLIYNISLNAPPVPPVSILMTYTTPGCPLGPYFIAQVKEVAAAAADISPEEVEVNVTFDPPWTQDSMSEELKLLLSL